MIVYDGSFEAFLTLIYEVYYSKLEVGSIQKYMPQSLFVDDIVTIEYDEIKSAKVLRALQKKFTKQNFELILNTFMCDSESFEMELLEYIVLGFKDQKQLQNINNKSVFYLQNLQKELFRQNHKMTGFVRFVELEDGVLYAKIETKFNVLYFLGKHFLKRFNNQNYIIHDINRQLAFIKNDSFVGVQSVASYELPTLSSQEEKFQKLWKTFFESVAIESRTNKKLQRQMVPLLYQTYMTEFE